MSDERLRTYHATTEAGVDVELKASSWDDALEAVQREFENCGPIRLTMREYIEAGFQSALIDTNS